jgi:hypothetical protein
MRIRSTGLGKTELECYVENIWKNKSSGDYTFDKSRGYLILSLRTTDPVRWHVRAAVTWKDLATIIRSALKLSVISFILSAWRIKNPQPPEDY